MRFQVPQFVDIEDKIIGPFTLKQFMIYVVAVMLLIPVYTVADLSLFLTIAIPIIGIAAAFAHVKIYGRSLFAVIGNALNFTNRGQLFIWKRAGSVKLIPVKGDEINRASQTQEEAAISLLQQARLLDTAGKVVTEDVDDPITGEPVAKN